MSVELDGDKGVDESSLVGLLERQFLAALLGDPPLAKVVRCEPEWFTDARNGALFRGLRVLDVDVPSAVEIADATEREGYHVDAEYITELGDLRVDGVTLDALNNRAARIHDAHLRAVIQKQLSARLSTLSNPQFALQDVLGDIHNLIANVSKDAVGNIDPTGPAIMKRMLEKQPDTWFKTGLRHIDTATTVDGFRKRHLLAFAAQYGGYKTAVTINLVNNILEQGLSVAYVALEDNADAFTQNLMAVHSGVPLRIVERAIELREKPYRKEFADAIVDARRWIVKDVAERWRVYDASCYPVHRWRQLPALVALDKVQYKTDVVCIDYLQALTSDYHELAEVMKMISRVAQEQNIAFILLNQMSNDSLRNGTNDNMFAAKGGGDVGAAVHLGIELRHDKKQARMALTEPLLERINATGVQHFLSMDARKDEEGNPLPSEVAELVLTTKKIRRGRPGQSAVLIDPSSGKIVLQMDAPMFHDLER